MTGAQGAAGTGSGGVLFGMSLVGVFVAVLFGMIGLVYLRYGKKTAELWMIVCGLALMIFPYFISKTLPMVLVGVVIAVLPFVIRRF